MSNNHNLKSIIQTNIDDRNKTSPILQPRPRKFLMPLNRSPILSSPTHKTSSPEIVRPNCSSQLSNNAIQNEVNSSRLIQSHHSSPELYLAKRFSQAQRPLDALAPVTPKKNRQTKKIRNSCSVDTSWSPNIIKIDNNDDVIRKKYNRYSDDALFNDNPITIEQLYGAASDDQISPLCNADLES